MVYLIHLDTKLEHAEHYLGWTKFSARRRFKQHVFGYGARMLEVCNERNINYRLARIWPKGTRKLERKLKDLKGSSAICPICNPKMKKKKYRFWRKDALSIRSENFI